MSNDDVSIVAKRRSLLWRIHFWAALLATPFGFVAALTGLFYVFTPQIEHGLYAGLDSVVVSGERRKLDDVVAAALATTEAPSMVISVLPGAHATDSVRVNLKTPDQQRVTVYVDPYRAIVLGQLPEQQRFNVWARKLHSTLLQGEGWRWMIELSASWMLVMLMTGIYLWWPRGSQSGLPVRNASGRRWWQQWHAFTGVVLALLTLVMLTTGITWSRYAGAQVRTLRDVAGQASPRMPANLSSTPMASESLSWQGIWDAAQREAPSIGLNLMPPKDGLDVWRISKADLDQPTQRIDLALDAWSGAVLYRSAWAEQTAFGKATALGIPFHRGELGVWNQVLLLLFGVGVLFSLLSGWVMYFRRSRKVQLGLPQLLPGAWRSLPVWMWLLGLTMMWLMPLLGLTFLLLMLVEWILATMNVPGVLL